MEDNNNQTEQRPENKKHLILFLVIFVVLIFAGGFFLFERFSEKSLLLIEESIVKDPFIDLNGTIYITLASLGDRETDLYAFDVETGNLEKLFDDDFVNFMSSISPDGKRMVYSAAPLDRDPSYTEPFTEWLQLFIRNIQTGERQQLTETTYADIKRFPEWSPDGTQIAFTGRYDYFGSLFKPDTWDIFIIDLLGNEQLLDSGTFPQWSPDGSQILYLKNDGLYRYDIVNAVKYKVRDIVGGEGYLAMHIDVSKNDEFVWGIPGRNEFALAKIVSWDPFRFENMNRIVDRDGKSLYHLLFSPDSRYIVALETNSHESTRERRETQEFRIVIYNTETFEKLILRDLNDYNFDMAFITDWK